MPGELNKAIEVLLNTENQVKAFVLVKTSFSFVFRMSVNLLYSMINSLQITAHLPLNNIVFKANAETTFKFLISIVSFDFIELKDLEMGFTYTDPWSPNFAMLDYESLNFVENLGSVMILILLLIMWIGFSLVWYLVNPNCKSEWF